MSSSEKTDRKGIGCIQRTQGYLLKDVAEY
jgi:hypothetical protein